MAQRIAVLLAVASILVIVCAAEGPSMEAASAQKYDKKSHNKHEHEKYDKPDKHDKEYKPDSYKPDSYRPDSYKPDGYRPDSYKPEGYKPDGYKSDEYRHKHRKSPRGEYKENYGNPGYNGYNGYEHEYDNYGPGNNYGPEGYDYQTPDGTPGNTPYLYDSGYYGGNGGARQTIRLDVLLPENLLNTTGLDPDNAIIGTPCNSVNPSTCNVDFGLICGLRRSNPYGSYVPEKSYEEKFAPLIQSIVKPLLIGRGYTDKYINWQTLSNAISADPGSGLDIVKNGGLVIVNGDQKAYIVSQLTGSMTFAPDAEDCHPILNGDSKVDFTNVPVYVMIAKIALPADPSAYIALNTPTQTVSTQSYDESSSKKSSDSGVQNTLCGIALVARGPVKVTTKVGTATITYSGTMEYVKSWTDGITTVPRLNEEPEVAARGSGGAAFLDNSSKRLDAVCKTNDVPFAHVGSLRLDVVRDPTP